MTPEQQRAIIDRLLVHAVTGASDRMAHERTIAAERYQSPAFFAREFQSLFRRLPLVFGLASLVPKAGDFYTCNDLGVPILITRTGDGRLHAFLNACTHRGARLVNEETGCGRNAFACPYHGWTFGSDGQLLHITRPECFPHADTTENGLVRLPVQERFGLIWVILDPLATIDVDAYVGGLGPELAALELENHVGFRTRKRDYAGNWKFAMENLMEAYHVPHAHSKTVSNTLSGSILVDRFGLHQRFVSAGHGLAKLADTPRHRWRLRACAGVTYFLFPNTVLAVHPDQVLWQRAYPKEPTAAVYAFTPLIPATAQGDSWTPIWESRFANADQVLAEDVAITERIGAGIATGRQPGFLIGLEELAIAAFHESIDTAMTAADMEST